MSDINELERRITSALERIGKSVETYESGAAVDTAELDALKAALEDEKLVSGQLEERNKKLHAKLEVQTAELAGELETQRMATAKLDMEMQRMRAANEQLRTSNAALREANERGVGEPHLINKAMLAELEGLRAARAVDQAEAGAVVETINTLLTQAAQAEESA
ncbi:hypothetical protein KO498_11985 [Lentibacter algarum]|uniref:hypothetical protein n=1 Tax=Lentibacter algarum TaxID=576131 RepID=UPI001C09CF49|nr:hypothetical protein [Lentibacter algarum]MBU2982529.1 hypothetical protein [Lentibacter algarum]